MWHGCRPGVIPPPEMVVTSCDQQRWATDWSRTCNHLGKQIRGFSGNGPHIRLASVTPRGALEFLYLRHGDSTFHWLFNSVWMSRRCNAPRKVDPVHIKEKWVSASYDQLSQFALHWQAQSKERLSVSRDPSFQTFADSSQRRNARVISCLSTLSHGLLIWHGKQPAQKYKTDDEVYSKNDYDINGRPRYRRYWVCCIRYNERTKEWWYKLKDGPRPHGRDVAWVCERMVAEWNF